MNQALAKAIKINRQIQQETKSYNFEIAFSEKEEKKLLENKKENEFLTILRLYVTNTNEDSMDNI